MRTILRRLRAPRVRVPGRRPILAAERGLLLRRRVVAGLTAVAAAWVSFGVYHESTAGHAADQRVDDLSRQNDALRAQIADRKREISEAQTDGWLIEEARRLGFVRDGEQVYVPFSGSGALPPDGGIDPGPLPNITPRATPGAPGGPITIPTPTPVPTPTSTPSGGPIVVPAPGAGGR